MLEANAQYRVTKTDINTGEEVDKQLLGYEVAQHFPELVDPSVGTHVQDYTLYVITTVAWY